ncbi:thymidine kinase [Carboxydothermus islandicus]|uniref:Thymidine kinase n=1 Tax=Carboxydothermus islandicus TaxID=661089 RepID=A0A1L8CZR2_9THEO|nr:thymidine kinase [Carboxydothermus islandicus]GAV24410.1 thymidine kinase [Carboxydothermus islandicus]
MGRIEVITGPMFSGKSEELVRRALRLMYARKKVIAFHHALDNRFGHKKIASRSGFELESYPVSSFDFEIIWDLAKDYDAVLVDEAQFFSDELVDTCLNLRRRSKIVVVSGLDLDVYENPFGPMPKLLALADRVDKLKAVCFECGEEATISYRLSGEKEQIVVGDKNYIALCYRCYYARKKEER